MLILTRRLGEKLIIGDNIVITIIGVKGNQIRIGIEAPKDVAVNRSEIYDRVLAEQGEVKSFALQKKEDDLSTRVLNDDNIGNTIQYDDPEKTKKILEMINTNPLTEIGKP